MVKEETFTLKFQNSTDRKESRISHFFVAENGRGHHVVNNVSRATNPN